MCRSLIVRKVEDNQFHAFEKQRVLTPARQLNPSPGAWMCCGLSLDSNCLAIRSPRLVKSGEQLKIEDNRVAVSFSKTFQRRRWDITRVQEDQ